MFDYWYPNLHDIALWCEGYMERIWICPYIGDEGQDALCHVSGDQHFVISYHMIDRAWHILDK